MELAQNVSKMITWLVFCALNIPQIEPYTEVPDLSSRSYLDLQIDRFTLPIWNPTKNPMLTSRYMCCTTMSNASCLHKCHVIMGLCLTEYEPAKWSAGISRLASQTRVVHENEQSILPISCPHGKDQFLVKMRSFNSTHLTVLKNQTYRFRLGALSESGLLLTMTIYHWKEDIDLDVLQRFEGKIQPVHPDNIWSTLIMQPVMKENANGTLEIPYTNATVFTHPTIFSSAQIEIAYRYACRQHYYGPSCSHYCAPRNSVLGHYRCHPRTGALICDPGWSGTRCNQAICRRGCVHGICEQPEQCRCLDGWNGPKCDQCVPLPGCVNGQCHFNPTLPDWEPYTCECLTGWDGMLCNINKNACLTGNDLCQNGGRCLPTPDIHGKRPPYICLCPDGFQGTHCERKIADCRYHGCGTNGTCQADGNCTCTTGYYGSECQFNQVNCSESPCLGNGSRCEMILSQHNKSDQTDHNRQRNQPPYECHCAVGRYGTNCEFEQNWCATMDPCFNGGRCVNVQGGYVCICPPNFTGTRCEQSQIACRNDSCANGGECLDYHSHFSCHCPLGWTGLTCRENVNECAEIPRLTGRALCAQGAGCRDLLGSYQCLCPPGWTGRHCEQHVIQSDNLCRNASDCIMNSTQSNNASQASVLQPADTPFTQNNPQSIIHIIILFTVLGIALPLTFVALVAGMLLLITNCHSYGKDQRKIQWLRYKSAEKSEDDQALQRTSINRYPIDTELLPPLLPDCFRDNAYPSYSSLFEPQRRLRSHSWHKAVSKYGNTKTKPVGIVSPEKMSPTLQVKVSGAKKKTKQKSSFNQSGTRDFGGNSLEMERSRFPYMCMHSHDTTYPSAVSRFPYIDHAVINTLTRFPSESTRAYSPPPPYEEHLTVSVVCEQEQ